MIWYWLLGLFKVKLSTDPIPDGTPYCYVPDVEKNNVNTETDKYYIKPCKYYKHLGGGCNGCGFLGVITDDSVFDDQVKICGEKEGYGDDYVSDDYVG